MENYQPIRFMILTRDVWYETIPNVNGTIHENDKKKY